jgi:hydroxymethylpyrimidine pyrophosphatase-like HAD family hydrolase
VNVVPKGIDKGSGLQEVCAELAMPLESVGYVGEGWADWPALAQVLVAGGRGVMVGKDAALRQQVAHMGGEILDGGSHGLVKWLTKNSRIKLLHFR